MFLFQIKQVKMGKSKRRCNVDQNTRTKELLISIKNGEIKIALIKSLHVYHAFRHKKCAGTCWTGPCL